MNCEKFRSHIAAFLAGELDERSSDEYRKHAEGCSSCAAEMTSTAAVVDMLKNHPDRDVPECVEARVLSKLDSIRGKSKRRMPSPVPLRSRIQGAFTMKRAMIAAGLMIVAAILGLGILPWSKGNAVLAQVANAMKNVKSAHVVGYEIGPKTGERRVLEMWTKQPGKFRAQVKVGADIHEIADDGTQRVQLDKSDGRYSATISPSEGLPPGIPGLSWFDKNTMLAVTKDGIVDSRSTTLPDGRRALVIELAGLDPNYAKSVITIDEATDLLVQAEDYRNGELVRKIERVEYNIEVADSMFAIKIPKNAVIKDKLHPTLETPEQRSLREDLEKTLAADDAELLANCIPGGDHCGTPRHSGMKFAFVGPGEASLWYVMSRNAYYVHGRAIVTDSKTPGYERVVVDGWLTAPYKPDKLPGSLVMRIDKPGDYREFKMPFDNGYDYFCAERIQNVGKGPLIIMDDAGGMTIYGEAKVYPQGTRLHNGQKFVSEGDIRSIMQEYDFAKADFGTLPVADIKAMRAEMEKHNKALKRYWQDQKTATQLPPGDAEQMSNWVPGRPGSSDHFVVDPETGMTIYYIPSRGTVYVAGRARLVQRKLFKRTERVVENEEIEAPSPDYKAAYEERKKKTKQVEEYNKQHTNMRFDDWLEQHPELQ